MTDWSTLYRSIGYEFQDNSLVKQALTHRSVVGPHNERLEFLGDAVLSLSIAQELFQQFPQAQEGQMSRMRSSLVRGHTLAAVARELNLNEFLIMGISEHKSGGHQRDSILEDAVEALIGAIYLDSDFDMVSRCVLQWFSERIHNLSLKDDVIDAKSRLQEYVQQRGYGLPQYEIIKTEGAEHEQIFTVRCCVVELALSIYATGASRKKAEQAAAELLLEQL